MKKCGNAGTKHFSDPNAFMSVQILWMAFMKILISTIQTDKEKLLT